MDAELKFVDEVRVLRHLNAVLDSKYFRSAPRLREFLQFIVTETLSGRGDQLKEYSIGVNVYGRKPDFDPKADSIVRVEAVKLRARLAEYYNQVSTDGTKIRLLKGGYIPTFSQISSQYDLSLIAELCAAGDFAVSRRTPAATALARQHFSRIIELAPSDPRGHIGWASASRSGLDTEVENPAEIIPRYEEEVAESLRLSPMSSQAHVARANLICATGDIGPRAMDEVNSALRLDPANASAHGWRGGLLAARGDFAEAIRHMHEAIHLEPLTELFQAYLGRILFYAGEHEQAVEKLIAFTRLDPAYSVARIWLALALSESGRFEEAIATGSELVNFAENSATRSCVSYVFARAGYRKDAASILQILLPPFQKSYVSPVWLASIDTALGMENEAANQLEAARKENSYALIWSSVDPRLRSRARAR
jgi:Tfp pilus assembly protein PilF